jgi:hypothetical protein
VNQIGGHARRRRFFEILRFSEHALILPAFADRAYQESFTAESPQAALNIQVKQEASILRAF